LSNRYTADKFIAAIPGSGGIISAIADRVGCDWHTAKKYIHKHPTVEAAWEAERNKITDKARHNIIRAIQEGDLQMSKWWIQVMDPEFSPSLDIKSGGEAIKIVAIAGVNPEDI